MLRAFIVNRVSKEEQRRRGYSLQSMVEACEEYAKQLDAEVVGSIEDDFSATDSDTVLAGLEPVFDAVDGGSIDLVIFYNISRVTRGGPGEATFIVNRLRRAGATVYYAEDRRKAGETPAEQMLDSVLAAAGQFEWQTTRERTMRGIRAKAKMGIYMGNGVPPYGYRRQVDDIGRTSGLVEHEQERDIVRSIYTWFVHGDGSARMGVRQICDRLRLDQVPTPGVRYDRDRKRDIYEWNPTTVYDILHHSVYRGVAYSFKFKVIGKGNTKKSKLMRERPPEEWIPTRVPALVDDATWLAAQTLLAEGKARSRRNSLYTDRYILGRRIRCACGYAIHGASTKRVSRDGTERVHIYYRCSAKIPQHVAGTCTLSPIRVDILDDRVWDWLCRRLVNPERVAADEAGQLADRGLSHFDARILSHEKRLGELDQQVAFVSRQARQNVITEADYLRQMKEINDERTVIRAALDRAVSQRGSAQVTAARRQSVVELTEVYRQAAETAPFTERRTIIDALDVTVEVDEVSPRVLSVSIYSIYAFDPELDILSIILP